MLTGAGNAPRCTRGNSRIRGRGVGQEGLGLEGIYDDTSPAPRGAVARRPRSDELLTPGTPPCCPHCPHSVAEAAQDGLGLGPKAETKPHGADAEGWRPAPSLHRRPGLPEGTAGASSPRQDGADEGFRVPAGGEARDKQPKSRSQRPSPAASLAVLDDSVLDDRAERALRRPEFHVTQACF